METLSPDLLKEAQAHLERAYACEETGRLEQAQRQCELAIQLDPNLAEAHNLQGIVLEQMGQTEQAIAAYCQAIRLNPNFGEAQQNLLEIQDEVSQVQHAIHQRRTRKAVLWGTLGFGVSFLVVEAVFALVRIRGLFWTVSEASAEPLAFSFYINLPGFHLHVNGILLEDLCGALLFAIGSCVGVALIGQAIKLKKVGLLAAASGLGCGLAYELTAITYQSLLPDLFMDLGFSFFSAMTAATTARYALIGACTGGGAGAVQKSWAQVGLLALAGALGFGLYGVFTDLVYDWILLNNDFLFSLKKGLSSEAVLTIASGIHGMLVGVTSGALLGFALGQKEPTSQPAEAVRW